MNAELRNDPEIESLAPEYDASTAAPLSTFAKRLMVVWWPAFLMAGLIEMLVFAFVDPEDLRWLGGAPVDLSRTAVYTVAFFAFWVIVGLAGSITQLLMSETNELNKRRFP
jgi:uncharacterized membrane protein YedE/YeeE